MKGEKGKIALITGIGGQDGSYLAELLLEKDYLVRGIVRRASLPNTKRIDPLLKKYGEQTTDSPFFLKYADLSDPQNIRNIIEEFEPDEIYNLGAQSHVGISFDCGRSTFEINTLGAFGILDAIRDMGIKCKYYQASSSEMFGISPPPQNEKTPMLPQSPYGIAKLAAYHLTKMHRTAYGIFASNGILFNHESPRRGFNFVTRKITRGLAKILAGEKKELVFGNLDAQRDWGFSKEYVQAMWKILQHNKPDDFVIATNETHTIKDFIKEAFNLVDLNYQNFIKISDRYKRPADVPALLGDSSKARRELGWNPKIKFKELIYMMVASDLKEELEEIGKIPIEPEVKREDEFYVNKGKELAKRLK